MEKTIIDFSYKVRGGFSPNGLQKVFCSYNPSDIAVMRPGKETVIEPFEIGHTDSELIDLAKLIKSLGGRN